MDVGSHRYTNVDSEYFLIVFQIQARISNAKNFSGKKVEKYDHEKMTLLEKQVEYKTNLTEHVEELAINPDDSLDSRWNKINCTIHKRAEEVFGKTSTKQPNDWVDKECQEATEVKNKAYVNMQHGSYTRASADKYREARQKEKTST